MLFVLVLDHIGNVFLYFDLYGHVKLDLKFVHGDAEKCVVHISEAGITEENNRTTRFGEKSLFICRHIYSGVM